MDYSQIRASYIDENGNKIYSTPGFKPGVERIKTISSDGGTNTSGSSWISGYGLVLSLSDIEAIIPQLQNVSAQLKEMWNSSMNSSLARIEDSWAGEDALRYTEKVLDSSVSTERYVAQKISNITTY